jgi:hypothetical protein
LASKAIQALRAQESALAALPLHVVEAGMAAYRRSAEEGIAPPLHEFHVHELVVRIYRAMRLAGG